VHDEITGEPALAVVDAPNLAVSAKFEVPIDWGDEDGTTTTYSPSERYLPVNY
jgi:hypothetical protein